MISYRRDFDESKYVSFLTKNDELLEKYNEIWKKSAIASKKNLIVILYVMKKTYKEKINTILTIRNTKRRLSVHFSISNID